MWSSVTLKMFDQLRDIERSEIGIIEKAYKRLQVLGIKPAGTLEEMVAQIPVWIQELPKTDIPKEIIVAGKTFRPHINFAKMNPDRFLDFVNTIKDRNPEDPEGWAYLSAIVLSQPGEPYDYETHIARADFFWEKMTFDQVYPLAVFFSAVLTHLLRDIAASSTEKLLTLLKELTQSYKEDTETLQNVGDGSHT